jgi:hypothetical protein
MPSSQALKFCPALQPLTVAYKLGGGTVRGTVEKCAGGTVRLLPHIKPCGDRDLCCSQPCDSNDRYAITGGPPGRVLRARDRGDSPTPWYATQWNDDGLVTRCRHSHGTRRRKLLG